MGRPRKYTDEERKQRARDKSKRWREQNLERVREYNRNRGKVAPSSGV